MANSFDSSGNQHFTKIGEWHTHCLRKGLLGPYEKPGAMFYTNPGDTIIRATWNFEAGAGVINK